MSLLKPSHTRAVLLILAGLLLSACEVNEPSESSVPNLVAGVVSAPSADSEQFSSAAGIFTDPFAQLAGWLTGTANAAVTGLVPVSGATVELVRLDSQGNVASVIATTTSAGNGSYSFNNTPAPDSTLAVRVTGQSNTMRAIVTGVEIDVSPASEAVVDSIIDTLSGSVTLANFAVEEVSVLAGLVAGLDVDLAGLTFAQAVTAIRSASSPVLGTLITGFSGSGVEGVLHNGLYGGLQFETELNQLVGVVTNGLFARRGADILLVPTADGVREIRRA